MLVENYYSVADDMPPVFTPVNYSCILSYDESLALSLLMKSRVTVYRYYGDWTKWPSDLSNLNYCMILCVIY